MKKKTLFLALIMTLGLAPVTACNTKALKPTLTYGSYIEQKPYEESKNTQGGYNIHYNELEERLLSGENMAVAIYPNNSTCTCWISFKHHIKQLVDEYHYKIYTVSHEEIPANNEYGFKAFYGKESFYIIKDKKIVSTAYPGMETGPVEIFNSTNYLKDHIDLYFRAPNIYEIDQAYLDKVREKDAKVYISWNECNDCKTVNPYIYDFFNQKESTETLYYFDTVDLKNAQKESETETPYDDFKNSHGMSKQSNETFGYNTGYVPTIQIIKDGEIKDAITNMNDSIAKNENGDYYIKDSYFTQERLPNLSFLKDAEGIKTVLKGEILNKEDVSEIPLKDGNMFYYWMPKKAMEYHKPLLDKFLNCYF